jgi:hypothetical protein
MTNEDPPPDRVKPVPIGILFHAQSIVDAGPTDETEATIDCAWNGFFYVLRPGEGVKTSENKPLCAQNVSLSIGQ